jgi:hypothetical protein
MDRANNNKQLHSELYVAALAAMPVAYIRPIHTHEGKQFAVCTADGTELATFATVEAAFFAARQNDLEPMHIQ